ncbi:MAG: oligosaccharide flippase family protein [Gammaproteobacteria bacterium]|nr:oligosaccharide flippase family protein [Gammaproteobacteria bacterium]
MHKVIFTKFLSAMTFARRLITGTTYLTLSNGVVRLLSIVTMPILTHLLSPQTYGVAALVGTMISLVSVFALAGIDISYARAYLSARPPNGEVVEHFCWRFTLFAAVTVSIPTALVWWLSNRNSSELTDGLAVLLAMGIVFSAVNAMVQTRARLANRYRAMAIALILTGILGPVTSIVIAAGWRQDALALLLPMLLSYGRARLVAWHSLHRRTVSTVGSDVAGRGGVDQNWFGGHRHRPHVLAAVFVGSLVPGALSRCRSSGDLLHRL